MLPRTLSMIALCAALLSPVVALAQDDGGSKDEGASFASYGFKGFWLGAGAGLATGYLATGPHYESREWKTLVIGTGIGALSGLALGLTLSVADLDSAGPGMGWYVLRDMDYGLMLGALTGAAVGALVLIDSGRPKDVLTGLSAGALIGAGLGAVFGILEGSARARRRRSAGSHAQDHALGFDLSVQPVRGGPPVLVPTISGRF